MRAYSVLLILIVLFSGCVQQQDQHKNSTTSVMVQRNMSALEDFKVESCTHGPSCFDNVKIRCQNQANGNTTSLEKKINDSRNRFYSLIKMKFGLEKSDYNLSCAECDLGRGGFIKAKGRTRDGSSFEIYYHHGFCSSGGTDCGWSVCFGSDSDDLFKDVKTSFCNKISSYQRNDGSLCEHEAYDNTQKVRNKCMAGAYEKQTEDQKKLSIRQYSDRCKASVEKGSFDCMDY